MSAVIRSINAIQRALGWVGITIVLLVAISMTGTVILCRTFFEWFRKD